MDETINITALAVNDNPDQLYLMKRMLGSVGYKVLTACDGREAFDLLLRERVDILISDVMMPVLDGIELCRLVRDVPALKLMPILLVSALRKDADSVVEGLHAGADDYIEHPFEPVALAARVARLLERKSNICARLIDLAAGDDAPALLRALEEMDAELEQVKLKLEQWTLTA